MTISNKSYDRWKWVALIALPAVTALWLTIATTWGLPYATEIGATISAVDVFLGALLGISSKNYAPSTDGTLHITSDNEVYAAIETPTQESLEKGTITLAVKPLSSEPAQTQEG